MRGTVDSSETALANRDEISAEIAVFEKFIVELEERCRVHEDVMETLRSPNRWETSLCCRCAVVSPSKSCSCWKNLNSRPLTINYRGVAVQVESPRKGG